ncbi:MAG: isoaspartyl peptidase/L-asparaginase [Proteobacteria bacterium]|nr:MAG: isoaspartyl peptidase/L-asparaginase [Pseudomonadota bacterium]
MRLLCIVLFMLVSVVVAADKPIAIVIHGGAGTIERSQLSEQQEASIRADLKQALNAGYAALEAGQDATDAVVAAITILEDSANFNAGKGAVYTREKSHELDASIMRGSDLQAGAVAGVKYTKNPILAAQAVMLHSPHVMLSGRGADAFSKAQGLSQVENSYFDTEARLQAWEKVDEATRQKGRKEAAVSDVLDHEFKFGTVGAVAIDQNGQIVAGTSTGGMTYKAWGRIGDSPVIGAGTYADDRSCGISATGHGEYFIRYAVAHDICARVLYQNKSLQQAADEVINQTLSTVGGDGGIIGLDTQGRPVMIFNTTGMYRGFKTAEELYVAIYGDDKSVTSQ